MPTLSLNTPSVPQNLIKGQDTIETIPSYFKSLGYTTTYIHPFSGSFYNRSVLYPKYGFDNLYFEDTFTDSENRYRRYISDKSVFDQIKKQLQSECEKQKVLAEEVQRIQGQIRALKHDMKNHTMVILSYLEEEKSEDAKRYAGELLDKLNKMYTYVNVGNSLLNYIINNKLSTAKEQGCEIKAEIENLAFSYMDSVDFSALLNNLLDNAMEGALNSREKKLEISISEKKGFDVISVRNSVDVSVIESNPQFESKKSEEGHGFGMKQIHAIVQKYRGDIDIYEKENMFIVNIMLGAYGLSQ